MDFNGFFAIARSQFFCNSSRCRNAHSKTNAVTRGGK